MDLKLGATVAEIGAGNGSVAIAAADKVGPSGHVYATEIDEGQLQRIRDKVAQSHVHNVTVVESTAEDTKLPPLCCDAIYMIGVYHHFTEPVKTDASIFRALKPGRRRVIVDFRRPDVIRLGLSPLTTRFVDVWDAVEALRRFA